MQFYIKKKRGEEGGKYYAVYVKNIFHLSMHVDGCRGSLIVVLSRRREFLLEYQCRYGALR